MAGIKLGLTDELRMGNLDAKHDWGVAGDYAKAMWLMLQQDEPNDYVIATGRAHSVRQLVKMPFGHVGLDWEKYVVSDPGFIRPTDVECLLGDSRKAEAKLGWKPEMDFTQLNFG